MGLVKIPEELKGTKNVEWIFVIIFIIVLVINLFNFPMTRFLAGTAEGEFKVGWPLGFFIYDLQDPGKNPFLIWPLFVDFAIYLLMAYMIDVSMNYVKRKIPKVIEESEEEVREQN